MRNLKKVIALVAVFAMMVTSVAFAQNYSDVKEDDNYYEAIEMLSKLNILTGDDKDGDGVMDFRPNDTITRAEVAAVICRVQDLNNLSQTTTPFTDVPSSHWASGYVAQAAGQGIINGYGDGNFGPEDDVTYEQAVKMFVETLGYTPFVNANGGYPTGHLTAAQRYGVVDGVVGASVGAKATRGQIAQIAFNAIDTPIMDRSFYGKDEEFTIFDGTNNKSFETLLTRNLKVKKIDGIVTKNQVTTLDSAEPNIDTDKKAEVEITADRTKSGDLTTDNYNYEVGKIDTIYAADSNAADLLGYHVNAFVKETDRSGEFDVLAISASNKNKTLSFTLDQYDSIDGNDIKYFKNDNDNKASTATVRMGSSTDKTTGILYNGAFVEKTDLTKVFSNNADKGIVAPDSKYSGKVTLIDNGATNGYDVIKVEVASSAVVKEAKSSGKITFKEAVKNSLANKIELDFGNSNNDTVINLTKDGKKIEYTDLNEWDVLSVLYSGKNKYYDVKVIGSNKIDGSISSRAKSDTSYDGFEYTIDGKKYDVAVGCYEAKEAGKGWTVGTAGVFYVDDYGKIVAYDKNGSTTSSTTNGNYAYIINSSVSSDGFNKVVSVQMLDKSGKVVTYDLNDKVRFENGDTAVGSIAFKNKGTSFDGQTNYELDGKESEVAKALKNQFVTYEKTSGDLVKTITFFANESDDANTLTLNKVATSYEYDEDNKEIKVGTKFDVDDNTVVFFIKNDTKDAFTNQYDSAKDGVIKFKADVTASKTASKVDKASAIGDTGSTAENKVAAVFDEDNGVAGAILIFDTTGGISSSSSLAVIDSIGETNLDDIKTTSVKYYKDGVLMESKLDTDVSDTQGIENAKRGDLYKFSLNADGTIINNLERYASFVARDDETVNFPGEKGALAVKSGTTNSKFVKYGPVYDYQSSGSRIRIATLSGSKWDFNVTDSVKCANANVYVIDPNKKNNKVTVGDASDVDYDKELIKKDEDSKYDGTVTVGKTTIATGEQALGLMDFVAYAVNNDDDVIDVVIYKAYEFNNGNYTVNFKD